MSVLTVRNLDDGVRDRLRAQARLHGRSMESEVRAILAAAVPLPSSEPGGLGSRIAALFADVQADVEHGPMEAMRSTEAARAAVFPG